MMKYLFQLALALSLHSGLLARSAQDSLPANPADVSTPDAIIKALYDVISGDKGVPRNWDRLRSLFKPGAIMAPTGRKKDGAGYSQFFAVEDYIRLIGPNLEKSGFFEKETGRVTEQYGSILNAFSSYESRYQLTDALPFMRGVNSIQLWNDGSRWWILHICWQNETPDNPIPKKYLYR